MKSDKNVLGKGIEAIFKRTAHLREGGEKTLELPNGVIRREGTELFIRLDLGKEYDIRGAVEELAAAARDGLLDQLVDAEKMLIQMKKHLKLARAAVKDGDLDAALEEYQSLLKMKDCEEIRFNIALVHEDKNEVDAAMKQYRAILKMNRDYIPALNNLGLIYFNRKNLTKAMDYYQRLMKLDPKLSAKARDGELFAPRFGPRRIRLETEPANK